MSPSVADFVFIFVFTNSKDLLQGGAPCPRPDRLSNSTLQLLLQERGLSLAGSRAEKEARIKLSDRCEFVYDNCSDVLF